MSGPLERQHRDQPTVDDLNRRPRNHSGDRHHSRRRARSPVSLRASSGRAHDSFVRLRRLWVAHGALIRAHASFAPSHSEVAGPEVSAALPHRFAKVDHALSTLMVLSASSFETCARQWPGCLRRRPAPSTGDQALRGRRTRNRVTERPRVQARLRALASLVGPLAFPAARSWLARRARPSAEPRRAQVARLAAGAPRLHRRPARPGRTPFVFGSC